MGTVQGGLKANINRWLGVNKVTVIRDDSYERLLSAYYQERERLGRDITEKEKDIIRERVIKEIDAE